jgi:hypothetical protein
MIRLLALQGIIRRRALVNFRVDPRLIQTQLPAPFTPRLVDGCAIAGICLIRLEQLRPRGMPAVLGFSSESAAHRVGVTWRDRSGCLREGVYIPRRDTASRLNASLGGRVFPGEHQYARFSVREDATTLDLAVQTFNRVADVRLRAHVTHRLPSSSCFGSLAVASAFFASGSVGYSATRECDRMDGLELRPNVWHLEPLDVESVVSRYFSDPARFPAGSVAFDSALVMRNIPHEWRPLTGSPAAAVYA